MRNSFLLLRIPNLVMIALSQLLLRLTIIDPFLAAANTPSEISHIDLILIILSTIFIAAGGYVVNDFFDVEIDRINKPGNNYFETENRRKNFLKIYLCLSAAGIGAGIYLSLIKKIPFVMMINLLSFGLLFLYSQSLKKIFLFGNIIIALLTAMSLLVILFSDKQAFADEGIRKIIFAYSLFAFFLTIIREIIKDMQDAEGDRLYGRKTIPVISGIFFSKLLVFFLLLVVLSSLVYIQYIQKQWEDMYSFLYVTILVDLPLLAFVFFLARSDSVRQFRRLSILAKVIMFSGIMSMLVFYLIFKSTDV